MHKASLILASILISVSLATGMNLGEYGYGPSNHYNTYPINEPKPEHNRYLEPSYDRNYPEAPCGGGMKETPCKTNDKERYDYEEPKRPYQIEYNNDIPKYENDYVPKDRDMKDRNPYIKPERNDKYGSKEIDRYEPMNDRYQKEDYGRPSYGRDLDRSERYPKKDMDRNDGKYARDQKPEYGMKKETPRYQPREMDQYGRRDGNKRTEYGMTKYDDKDYKIGGYDSYKVDGNKYGNGQRYGNDMKIEIEVPRIDLKGVREAGRDLRENAGRIRNELLYTIMHDVNELRENARKIRPEVEVKRIPMGHGYGEPSY
ncbi:unnamed protein product [Brachionus calyciflorus]|uniref:Uncharacterized protein n=1 Tax=Brachionus calyciflorus TaxID=104777 RepID=A0A814JI68_9BILA|nr:unnamed protein product [Brachionus calyciflorus]